MAGRSSCSASPARSRPHDLDELWVVEDLTFHGGFTQATAALAATTQISVGIGIAPAVVRNVAYTAMEIATLAQMFPGRFHMGFGHGVDFWIEQVGAAPSSWMSSLREVVVATTQLLAGENVTMHGRARAPRQACSSPIRRRSMPPISLGVRGPRSMALAGEVADGIIFAEWSGPKYLAAGACPDRRSAEVHGVRPGQRRCRRPRGDDAREDGLAPIRQPTVRLRRRSAPPLDELVIAGDPATWFDQAQKWVDAGAGAVVFCPLPTDPVELPL